MRPCAKSPASRTRATRILMPAASEIPSATSAWRPGTTRSRWKGLKTSSAPVKRPGFWWATPKPSAPGRLPASTPSGQIGREKPLVLPDALAVGDAIRYVRSQMRDEGILSRKYTFSGSVFFDRMNARGLYSTDVEEIRKRVDKAGMVGVFGAG